MELYGFEYLNDGIELVYSLDNELLSYCLRFIKPDYPFKIFIKFSSDFSKILEYYPYYVKDFETSINLFTGKEKYDTAKFGIFYKYYCKFISYDGINKPIQIYDCPINENIIYRYDNDKLNRKYLYLSHGDIIKNITKLDLSDELKNSILEKDPNYIILYLDKNDSLLRLIMGFEANHIFFKKLTRKIKFSFLKS
jgi:hypothetical protein